MACLHRLWSNNKNINSCCVLAPVINSLSSVKCMGVTTQLSMYHAIWVWFVGISLVHVCVDSKHMILGACLSNE